MPQRHRLGLIGLCIAGLAAVGAVLGGCSGAGTSPPASASAPGVPAAGLHDLGRRSPGHVVYAAITLRFNRATELTRFVDAVSDPKSPIFRHFLSRAAFYARFAPTVRQHARVLDALRRAGFTIAKTYPSLSFILAGAPTAVAERFFGTQIHDFNDGRYGTRYSNVNAVHVPSSIAGLVRAVELNSVVYARGNDVEPDAQAFNRIKNPGFENRLKDWGDCDAVHISTKHPFAGKYSAQIGSLSESSGSVDSLETLCQAVKVPRNATFGAHTYSITNVTNRDDGYQEIGLMSKPGKILTVLWKGLIDKPSWKTRSWSLRQYAGQNVYVFFAVDGKGQKKLYQTMFVDNVSLSSATPPPSPSPSPSASASASPSPTPRSSPTPTPYTSPSPTPYSSPSASASATPTATASPTPTTSPTVGPTSAPTPVGEGPGQPLAGPTYGPTQYGANTGWAPRGIADGLDLPVQHGYNGHGSTVAMISQTAVRSGDLTTYLSNNDINRNGSLTETPLGAGPSNGDPTEGMLEVETIAGLAPGTDIIVYEPADLSNSSILGAYQEALANSSVEAIDSSFGACESNKPSFDDAVEQDAVQGAATGLTFVTSSGDMGAACDDGTANVKGVQVPASSTHFFSVGGTNSVAPGTAANPAVWNGNNGFFVGASGGGVSQQFSLPSYQQGVAGSPASTTQRNVPDVAFPAVDDDLHIFGDDEYVGGTSWSSAIATALLAQSVQICGPVGFINPAVYEAFAADGEGTVFTDVTQGNNTYLSFTGYDAATGYDDASGIGIPSGFHFAVVLCGKTIALRHAHP